MFASNSGCETLKTITFNGKIQKCVRTVIAQENLLFLYHVGQVILTTNRA